MVIANNERAANVYLHDGSHLKSVIISRYFFIAPTVPARSISSVTHHQQSHFANACNMSMSNKSGISKIEKCLQSLHMSLWFALHLLDHFQKQLLQLTWVSNTLLCDIHAHHLSYNFNYDFNIWTPQWCLVNRTYTDNRETIINIR